MKSFFLSLKTTVWTLLGLVVLFFIGSYMMPVHRNVFQPMNDLLLFQWVGGVAAKNPLQTWWFFLSLAALVLLTINTIVCSIQAIKVRWHRADFLRRISPQIVHVGFLFILFAHLLGAAWGYKLSGGMLKGTFAGLPENRALYLRDIRVETDARGFPKDWSADVVLFENSERVATGTLGPNRPLFYRGAGIYLKSFELDPRPVALLMITRDPGTAWAFMGGILFILGSAALLALKWKQR